jgi:hydroxymethylpyrimidine pyrophosphatase-like HAD family hydrolase
MSADSLLGLSLFSATGAFCLLASYARHGRSNSIKLTLNKKYKAVALDLDGTALNSKHQFSDRIKAILLHLQQRGVLISICTGRSVASLLPVIESVTFIQDIPVVVYNGSTSFVISVERSIKQKLFSTPLSATDASDVLTFAESLNLVAQYYMETTGEVFGVPTNESHILLLERYAKLVGRPQKLGKNYDEVISESLAAKILILILY